MRRSNIIILLTMLMSTVSTKSFAHDIAVENADGVIIYYNWVNSNELAVSYRGSNNTSYYNEYFGKVVIPELVEYDGVTYSVTSIGAGSFADCSSLSSINIPKSVTYIGINAFRNCSIDKVIIEDISAWCNIQLDYWIREAPYAYFQSDTNPLYNSNHLYKDENTEITTLEIPEGVTEISEFAFGGCSSIKEVKFPKSLKTIRMYAFRDCSGLTSLNIPNNVTNIGGNVFYGCNTLTDVELHCSSNPSFSGISSIKTLIIGDEKESISGFDGCIGLTSITIPNSVTSIGNRAFYGCTNLSSISFPNNLNSIGENAFSETAWYNNQSDGIIYLGNIAYKFKGTMPENAEIVIKDGTDIISVGIFSDCSNPFSVKIPSSITSIGYDTFRGCTGLTSISIPNSVTEIGHSAFEGCNGLTSVHITDLEAWCKIAMGIGSGSNPLSYAHHLFLNGEEITNLIIPSGVTSIGYSAFSGCSGLTSVTIPNSVTSIGGYAFSGCSGLTSVTIPNSVTSIGGSAFSNTAWYDNQPDGLVYAGKVAYKYKGDMPDNTKITLKDGTLSIAGDCFVYCNGLNSITIPQSVTSISGGAFNYCNGLTSITIPKSVTSFNISEFDDCNDLTTIILESKKPYGYVGGVSFPEYSNTKITIIVPVGTKAAYQAASGWKGFEKIVEAGEGGLVGIRFEVDGIYCTIRENNIVSLSSGKYFGHVGIPNQVAFNGKNYNLTSIDESSFYKCSSLTSVVIPESVTSIGNNAFSKCDNLKFIAFTSDKFIGYKQLGNINAQIVIPQSVYDKGIPNNITKFATYSSVPVYVDVKSIGAVSAILNLYPIDKDGNIDEENMVSLTSVGHTPGEQLSWKLDDENYGILSDKTNETLTLTVQEPKALSTKKARLLATAEEADDVEHFGFEWRRIGSSDLIKSKVVSSPLYNGTIVGTLNNLNPDVEYKYRPFYKSDSGEIYYGEWMGLFTGDADVYYDPEVYTKDAEDITKVSALLAGVWFEGTDDLEEKGFEYWTVSGSNTRAENSETKTRTVGSDVKKVVVSGSGNALTATLEGLRSGATYGFRSYAKTASGTTYGEEKTFKTILIGDVDGDGELTNADVDALAKHIIGQPPTGFNKKVADVNEDNDVNAADIVALINLIKNLK